MKEKETVTQENIEFIASASKNNYTNKGMSEVTGLSETTVRRIKRGGFTMEGYKKVLAKNNSYSKRSTEPSTAERLTTLERNYATALKLISEQNEAMNIFGKAIRILQEQQPKKSVFTRAIERMKEQLHKADDEFSEFLRSSK